MSFLKKKLFYLPFCFLINIYINLVITVSAFFEKSKGFLNPNIKQEDLAKEFGTNSTYLSIVINREKNMNFSNYLNSLRIRYLLELLEEDIKYYNFKLAALANITGFNNTTTFRNAFFKETGLPASKYLKDRIYNLDKLQYARS